MKGPSIGRVYPYVPAKKKTADAVMDTSPAKLCCMMPAVFLVPRDERDAWTCWYRDASVRTFEKESRNVTEKDDCEPLTLRTVPRPEAIECF